MPAFEGGIITERARDLLPEGFRRTLPPRVHDSGRIFRAINGLEELYETKGSGAAPEMLRREMGLMYTHDLEAALGTQLAEVDAVTVPLVTGAANTTASTTFSFPTLPSGGPCAAHRILSATITISGTAANFAGADFRAQPFGDPTAVPISIVDGASVTTIAGLIVFANWQPDFSGLWGKRETDYTFRVRSGAGGSATGNLQLLVGMVPAGVSVPR